MASDEMAAETDEGAAGGSLEEQRKVRIDKVAALRADGVDPYPDRFERSATSDQLRERFGALEPQQETGVVERVAGRVLLHRNLGRLIFLTLKDPGGTIQLFVSKGVIGAEAFARVAELDRGDWVGAEGEVMTTKTGELSVKAAEVRLLAKALRPLPEKHRGLADVDTRFRQRYVDLIVNEDAQRVFDIRHRTIATFRRVLAGRGFVEVETPVLQHEAGGAAARPFTTHHNALDMQLYLRIATELHLKRLVVGGMERVFEIGRIFRNEGIDTRHNPEFTTVEIYQALANQHDMMDLTEDLVVAAAQDTLGTTVVESPDGPVDLTPPWPRRRLVELVAEVIGEEVDPRMPLEDLRSVCDRVGLEYEAHWGPGRLVYELFDDKVERTLSGPVFVHEYPAEVSPLARRNTEVPELADRFELFVRGRELANAFSELNEPSLQRAAFEAQVDQARAGDLEAQQTVDEDYLRALEHGLPPTGGLGIGIDRLVMLLAGVDTIREVILFPTLRPEQA
ncbi:MAG: lysine--tRNA ligase [Actinomycetota bacterium]|nr:lysine--tRNA ligase [Actinomycetota bacterium]